MKRSEILQHMIEDIEQHLFVLEHRPNTKKHFSSILANELLDMLEGFGMLPPALPSLNFTDTYGHEWEPEKEIKK